MLTDPTGLQLPFSIESVRRSAGTGSDVLLRPAVGPAQEPARTARNGGDPNELERARWDAERLRREVELAERRRRAAEQLAHSEAALRHELEREQAARVDRREADTRAVLERLEIVLLRAREIRREVVALRLAADEAGRHGTVPAAEAGAVIELRRELDEERSLRAMLEAELAEDRERAGYVKKAIEDLGRSFDALRVVAAGSPVAAAGESEQSARAASVRGAEPPDPPVDPAGAVAPDRLAAALSRLREQSPPPPESPASEADVSPEAPDAAPEVPAAASEDAAAATEEIACWLRPAMTRLLKDDPATAGKVVLHLLPAQALVAAPIRYDLVVYSICLAVTADEAQVHIDALAAPRPLEEVSFRIEGDLAGLGRLLVYGPLRRRLSRGVASVRGDRRAVSALRALLREPLSLSSLDGAGVRFDPELALQLIAAMIEPAWTKGERFTVGYESDRGADRLYLLVRDGAPVHVSRDAPLGPVACTIRCQGEELFMLPAAGPAPEATVVGAAEPVARLREWMARAERGA